MSNINNAANLRSLFPVALLLVCSTTFAAEKSSMKSLEQRLRMEEFRGIHSLIVDDAATKTRLAEWYFSGDDETIGTSGPIALKSVHFTATTLHDVRSVTKSVVSLLFGIALAEGKIKSLETPALDYFPEYTELQTPERRAIQLQHLLSMTSGLRWDEFTYPYTDPRNSEIAMELADDPFRYPLSQPIDAPPGTRWAYSGGDVALIGAVIARATGMPLEEFARQRLFAPMNIQFEWTRNKGGARAASGLRLTATDMAKLGHLVRNGGKHEEQQLVPNTWIAISTAKHAQVDADPLCGMAYGYFWWLSPGCQFEPAAPSIVANGNGGQRIWIIPSQNRVITMTAGHYNTPDQGQFTQRVLAEVLQATNEP